jgi:hypothetical protein
MKLIETVRDIIIEASKRDVLINKIGFSESNAEILDRLCGPLSVWMGNKLIDYQIETIKTWDRNVPDKKQLIDLMNTNRFIPNSVSKIQSIMDWIRVGLNGNVNPHKDLTFDNLYKKSVEWHESLEVGQGSINYIENNPIILDFRDEKGNGLYWADLQTKNSEEECNRMGHCGRSSYGILYSLRQVIPMNDKYKLNKSLLTAAIGGDNVLYQLKGPKNTKPKEELHGYILPLFFVKDDDDYLIQDFGSEYESRLDFKLSDLPKETVIELNERRPELFSSRQMQKLLGKIGVIEIEPTPTTFQLSLSPESIDYYIDGGWNNKYKLKNGGTKEVSVFVEIMEGDSWKLWENYDNTDVSGYFSYTIDEKTKNRLWNMVKKLSSENNIELDPDTDLEDSIEQVGGDEILNTIRQGIDVSDADDYVNYLQKKIKEALENYGNVFEFNNESIEIQIDLSGMVDLDDNEIDEIFENHYYPDSSKPYIKKHDGYDMVGIFDELISNDHIEKPKFNYDDRWSPSPNDETVNENVNMYLDDLGLD